MQFWKKRGLTSVFNINFRFFSNHWVILTVTVSATFSGALAFNNSITATVCLDDCPCHYQSLLRVSHFYSRLSDTISVTLAVIATLSVFVTVTLPAPSLSLSHTPRWSRASSLWMKLITTYILPARACCFLYNLVPMPFKFNTKVRISGNTRKRWRNHLPLGDFLVTISFEIFLSLGLSVSANLFVTIVWDGNPGRKISFCNCYWSDFIPNLWKKHWIN